MFILDGCGWIPNATINFIANIVDIIKIFVPILLIIMGAIEFGKAVMAQQEDQIKKSQTAFIQKVIAGAAVFFVIVLVGWLLKVINNADSSLNANDALNCMSLMFNGGYNADTIDPMTPPSLVTTTTNNNGNNNNNNKVEEFYNEECKKAYWISYEDYKQTAEGKSCYIESTHGDPLGTMCDPLVAIFQPSKFDECYWDMCYKARVKAPYDSCVSNKFYEDLSQENVTKSTCMQQNRCSNINDCKQCANSIDKYNYCKSYASQETSTCVIDYPYLDSKEDFIQKCKSGTFDENLYWKDTIGKTTWNYCYNQYGQATHDKDRFEKNLQTCCESNYNNRLQEKQSCIENMCKENRNSLVAWYCKTNPDQC